MSADGGAGTARRAEAFAGERQRSADEGSGRAGDGVFHGRGGCSGKHFLHATYAKCTAGFARPLEVLREPGLLQKDRTFAARCLTGEAGAAGKLNRLYEVAFA